MEKRNSTRIENVINNLSNKDKDILIYRIMAVSKIIKYHCE